MPSARQKRHQTVSMKLADCQDSCRVFVLTSRSDHVIVYATAKLIVDGGLPNYRPTRLNDSGNFFRPLTKNRRFFHIFIFYLNSPNHALHSCILLGVFLVGKSYWISIFKCLLRKNPSQNSFKQLFDRTIKYACLTCKPATGRPYVPAFSLSRRKFDLCVCASSRTMLAFGNNVRCSSSACSTPAFCRQIV